VKVAYMESDGELSIVSLDDGKDDESRGGDGEAGAAAGARFRKR
jgi:uncharacterized membrane protein YcaP (DUF421 family)